MTVIAICMAKDEEDIIGGTVGQMLRNVDHVIVADNKSTDRTREVLCDLAARSAPLTVLDDHEIGYYQSDKMTQLAHIAREMGATWVVPFDADEFWTTTAGTVAAVLSAHEPDYGIVTAELYDYVPTALDPPGPDPLRRIQWRRDQPLPLPKVACRTHGQLVIEQGNHWARYPIPARATETPRIVVRHFPYRTPDQMIRKVRNGSAAYAATTGLNAAIGKHWREWGQWSDEQIVDCFRAWYWRPRPDVPHDVCDADGTVLEHQAPLVHDPALRGR